MELNFSGSPGKPECCVSSRQIDVEGNVDTNDKFAFNVLLGVDYHNNFEDKKQTGLIGWASELALNEVFKDEKAALLLRGLSTDESRHAFEAKLSIEMSSILKENLIKVDHVELKRLDVPDDFYSMYKEAAHKNEVDSMAEQLKAFDATHRQP